MTAVGTRLIREYVQHINGSPDTVLPLLCPTRENDWLPGWEAHCTLVQTASGYAETGCVFTTSWPGTPETTWTLTRHDPAAGLVEFARLCPGVEAVTQTINVRPEPGGSQVTVDYVVVPLPGADIASIEERWGSPRFESDLAGWESSMNHYLATGSMLPPGQSA
jgi:hypothetical protein